MSEPWLDMGCASSLDLTDVLATLRRRWKGEAKKAAEAKLKAWQFKPLEDGRRFQDFCQATRANKAQPFAGASQGVPQLGFMAAMLYRPNRCA